MTAPATLRSRTTRDMSVVDTFTLSPEAQEALAAETVRLHRRAALERAVRVAQRARSRRYARRFDTAPTADREYVRALETLLEAVERDAGLEEAAEEAPMLHLCDGACGALIPFDVDVCVDCEDDRREDEDCARRIEAAEKGEAEE